MKFLRRNRIMIIIGVVLILIGILLIYWNIPYSPFKRNFDKEMKKRLSRVAVNTAICTQDEVDKLPVQLKKHCEMIGLVGSKKYNAVNIMFHNTKFVFDSKKETLLKMDYDLWLLSDKPFRSAFCKSSILGIPFDGIDYCTDERTGGMKGRLGKAVELFDINNEQMYKAGLISWLAEGAVVNPSILLSEYITYEEIDATHIKAIITYNDVEGTGIFTFNTQGELIGFESNERQEEKINGILTPIGWKAVYGDYTEKNGILIPDIMQAIKVYPDDKEVVYFDANDMEIHFYK